MNTKDTKRLEAAIVKLKEAQAVFQQEMDELFGTGHRDTEKYGVIRLRRVSYKGAKHGDADRKGVVMSNWLGGCRIENEKSGKIARGADWVDITAILD